MAKPAADLPVVPKHYQQRALKACEAGEASPAQQKVAIKYIVKVLANLNEVEGPHYYADSATETAFALGRAYVGRQIERWVKLPLVPEDPKNEKEPYDDR